MKTAFTAIIFNGLVFLCNYKLVCGLREFLDNQVKQVTTHTKCNQVGPKRLACYAFTEVV